MRSGSRSRLCLREVRGAAYFGDSVLFVSFSKFGGFIVEGLLFPVDWWMVYVGNFTFDETWISGLGQSVDDTNNVC